MNMNLSSGDDTSCYTNLSPGLSLQMYSDITDHHDDQANNINSASAAGGSLLYGLSVLKDRVRQLQSLVAILLSAAPIQETASPLPSASSSTSSSSAAMAAASVNMHNAIQEIIMTASSMLLTFQHHMGLISPTPGNNSTTATHHNNNNNTIGNAVVLSKSQLGQALIYNPSNTSTDHHHHQARILDWPYGHDQSYNNNSTTTTTCTATTSSMIKDNNQMTVITHPYGRTKDYHHDIVLGKNKDGGLGMVTVSPKRSSSSASINYDIIELNAADLLAKYTHYCQVCGKGFKRDANLRMHMRAHGDEYKTSAALSNPMKKTSSINNTNGDLAGSFGSSSRNFSLKLPKKYSCPQEGCRWNQKHAKFQPLKSMICVKNHYKRSHCPKMYVCKRCNRKQFSVLSDLRTHEKHCGDLKWQCSCGTTFSRKDKLMGHVALFVGHTPIVLNSSSSSASTTTVNKTARVDSQALSQSQIDSIVKMIE